MISSELLNAHKIMIDRYYDLIMSLIYSNDNQKLLDFCKVAKTLDNSDKLSR